MTTNIYILKLQGGKYYIGKTSDPMKRYKEHLDGKGSAWTKKYAPIGVEKVIKNASPFDEDKYTKEYMAKYGIDKVRGGCGREGHYSPDCYANTHKRGYVLD